MKGTPTHLDPPTPSGDHKRGFASRVRGALGLEGPTREEVRRRMRSKPGLYDSLSPEALEYLRNYDGPEHLGPRS